MIETLSIIMAIIIFVMVAILIHNLEVCRSYKRRILYGSPRKDVSDIQEKIDDMYKNLLKKPSKDEMEQMIRNLIDEINSTDL